MLDESERRLPILFLILLVSADLVFIGLDLLLVWGYTSDRRSSLAMDRGYAEVYQYMKFFWSALILGWLVIEKRQTIYLVGALLFTYLFLDDSLQVHETLGDAVAASLSLQPAFGLDADDLGEIIVSAGAGAAFLIAGWVAYCYSNSFARRVALLLLGGVITLGVVGVAVDVLHVLVGETRWLNILFQVLEDGGELVVVSGMCWFVYLVGNRELVYGRVRLGARRLRWLTGG